MLSESLIAKDGAKDYPDLVYDMTVGNALLMHSEAVAHAQQFLKQELARSRFNTERAIEVLTIAVDNAVWTHIKDGDADLRRTSYAAYKVRTLGPKKARELLDDFVKETGAVDQRSARRWFRGLLGA